MIKALAMLLGLLSIAAVAAADTTLTPAEQIKVTGKLHGVIQDRLPTEVLIYFNAPRRAEIIRQDIPHAEKIAAVESYIVSVRTPILERLAGPGFTVHETLNMFNSIYATISTSEALKRVLSDPEITGLTGNEEYGVSLAQTLPLVRQPTIAAAGNTGTGSTVAVIDTGVRQDFYYAANSPILLALDMSGAGNPWDSTGHGNIIAQVVNATAPGARIISLKACQSCSSGVLSGQAVQAAFMWIFNNYQTYNIKAVNLSLSTPNLYANQCNTDMTSYVVDFAEFNIVPVVSAGNDGAKTAIAEPACARDTIAVGAAYDTNFGVSSYSTANCSDPTTAAWRVGCFSNSGPMLDIIAPGCRVGITASGTINSAFNCGTSLAAPVVTGAVAIMRGTSVNPTADARAIMSALVTPAFTATDAANNLTRPRLDIPSAVAAARAPPVNPGGGGTPAQVASSVFVPLTFSLLN